MKLDQFTWTVIGIVALLLVAAVVTVNLTGGGGLAGREYLTEDVPQAPVYNAFLALQRGDINMARAQYSKKVLAALEEQRGYDPFSNRAGNPASSRLRITRVEVSAENPERASVTFVQDTYTRGGPFGMGDTWSREMIVEVVREEGAWKLNSEEFFW